MAMTNELSKEIEAYIGTHKESKLERIIPVELSGKREDLLVYRIPIILLRYNIRNGRFAAEYRDFVSKKGRDLDPNKKSDALEIRKLLLNIKPEATRVLEDDLKRIGQLDPGVMTFDGSVVNGNRRMAVFERLQEQTGESRWSFLEMAMLPKAVTEQDLWRIEANLQFSKDERLEYGPINQLLKFRDGINAGLTAKQIAASMYGDFTEKSIKTDLERLELIETYLEYIGKKENYKAAERVHEHFIDIQKVLAKQKKNGTDPLELQKVLHFAFDMIKAGSTHWDIRKLNNIIKEPTVKSRLLTGIEQLRISKPAIRKEKPTDSELIDNRPDEQLNEYTTENGGLEEPEEEQSSELESASDAEENPVTTLFDEVSEAADATLQKNKPVKLLTTALTNLQNVELESPALLEQKARELINEIALIVQKLKTFTENK